MFNLKVDNTKNHFKNNLANLLKSRLEKQYVRLLKIDGYQNWRKLTSKDDSGATSGDAAKVQGKSMYDIFGTTL